METFLTVLTFVWATLNTPAGIAVLASVVVFAVNKLYARKPLWKKYQGSVIAAIKFAEKEIPDGSANKAVYRLDTALKYVLRVIEAVEGRLSESQVRELKEGLQVTHAELEAKGTLNAPTA